MDSGVGNNGVGVTYFLCCSIIWGEGCYGINLGSFSKWAGPDSRDMRGK